MAITVIGRNGMPDGSVLQLVSAQSIANITTSSVVASVYINDGSNDIYLVKDAPIPSGSALQVLDGGAKFVVQSGDALKVVSDTASSLDVWVSAVDAIST